ncbi:S8 family peptidase [Streptomyces puniciscabiei]|uniref:S8 family peptidase n=1 Tax=Streptomyces puniciscabiei TaxID=164348 RepID=UPI0033177E70
MRVLIHMKPEPDLVAAVIDPARTVLPRDVAGELPGVELDHDYTPVPIPKPMPAVPGGDPLSLEQPLTFSMAPEHAGVLVRGQIHDFDNARRIAMLTVARPDVLQVAADSVIESTPTCGGDAPVGDWREVAGFFAELKSDSLNGTRVPLAIVDTGINLEFVSDKRDGLAISLDAQNSWVPPGVTGQPGQFPVAHGSMCAFDTLIAAPDATLLDLPVLRSQRQGRTVMEGLLSDALAGYSHLLSFLEAMPQEQRKLVVSNSWGSFSPQWDFPPGNLGNYSDNPAHPFNLLVTALEQAGADIVFAAGNCGRECPDARCTSTDRPIGGANSHPRVLCVGGVNTQRDRVGYSSQGPGRLSQRKPDICAFTHFSGSEAFGPGTPDSGTSAACPVAAGVVAAIRTQWSAASISPGELRTLLRRTADDRGAAGFDYDYGYGVVDVPGIMDALHRRQKNGRTGGS